MEAEFGTPQWLFAMSTYAFASEDTIVCAYNERGNWSLGLLDARSKRLERLDLPFAEISYVCADPRRALFRAGSPTHRQSIVELDLKTRETHVLRSATGDMEFDEGYLSEGRAIEFPTEQGFTAH